MLTPLSTIDIINARLARLESLKAQTPIGIYGSFYNNRKEDLIRLRDSLRKLGYNARISEDLDDGSGNIGGISKSVWDRELSERLINESDAHIFVVPRRREGESDTLIQSVSMELERLNTLIECGTKKNQQIAVFYELGLMDLKEWGVGAVFRGLIDRSQSWTVGEFERINDLLPQARSFCFDALYRLGR
ncbi:hypothetical protein [Methanofollis sp. UBA420]|jgi:hypothetical protein|uniref:hypothetical protein n=1 Tax=Methanofollis sp. UBA420 TaxID=1915514 RepID=UPI00316ACDAA